MLADQTSHQIIDSPVFLSEEESDDYLLAQLRSQFPFRQFKIWKTWPRAIRWSPEEVMISLDQIRGGKVLWVDSDVQIDFEVLASCIHHRAQMLARRDQLMSTQTQMSFETFIENFQMPFVVLENQKELVAKNKSFTKLFPSVSDFLQLIQNKDVIQHGGLYQVNQVLTSRLTMYFLIPLTDSNSASASDSVEAPEMGVIAGSLAHELNNPMSSILLTLESLSFDDYPAYLEEELVALRKSATRAKELIQIFLGFSKFARPLESVCSWETQSNVAIDLLRFRAIEGNTGLKLRWKIQSEQARTGHCSYVAMLFYLIFDEILTSHAHQQLIKATQLKTARWIEIEGEHDEHGLTLAFAGQDFSFPKIFLNPLLGYLLNCLNLKLELTARRLFIHRQMTQ